MKKTITIGIVAALALAFGFFLFKISPEQVTPASSNYNSALSTDGAKKLDTAPAFDPASDHYLGSATAKNVLIEYGDMQCPSCAAYENIVRQVPTEFEDTVMVFRNFPLVAIHKNSVQAALANEAAGAQGKYWEMHGIMFEKQSEWENLADPLDKFAEYASLVGVANIEQFKTDVTEKKYLPKVENDNNQALGLGLGGTPSFIFNGKQLQNQDLAGLKKQAESLYVK